MQADMECELERHDAAAPRRQLDLGLCKCHSAAEAIVQPFSNANDYCTCYIIC
jgi:hypothetical protein